MENALSVSSKNDALFHADFYQNIHPDDLNLIDEFLINLRKQNKSDETIKSYREDLKRFYKWYSSYKEKRLKKINSSDISEYIQFIDQGGFLLKKNRTHPLLKFLQISIFRPKKLVFKKLEALSKGSQKRHLSTLKNFFQYLKETREDETHEFIINPVKSKIHHIKLKDKDILSTPMLSREDFQKIDESVYRTKERLAIYLLYYGGLRLSELSGLKFEDFNPDQKSIKVLRKGGDLHTFKLRSHELIFKQYFFLLEKGEKGFLFSNAKGVKLTERALYNLIKKIISKAKVSSEVSPHSFRKACATEFYLETKNLLLVRDYLNHKDAKVTQTYIDKMTLERYSHGEIH